MIPSSGKVRQQTKAPSKTWEGEFWRGATKHDWWLGFKYRTQRSQSKQKTM